MAALPFSSLPLLPHPHLSFSSPPNPNFPSTSLPLPKSPYRQSTTVHSSSNGSNSPLSSPPKKRRSPLLLPLAASAAVLLLGFRARANSQPPPPPPPTQSSELEDEEARAAFEQFKSKTFALTVPLRIVALRGSIPPSWVKDFFQVQGKRLKFSPEYSGNLESIFGELSAALSKGSVEAKNAMAADLVSVGDSWLGTAVKGGLIEPMKDAEEQDWYKSLSNRWKVYLCRNNMGDLDPNGYIWGAPYRWGTMVIAYKKNKFKKHKMSPIEDWGDLWRPELSGKISMVDSPREVVGAVLKHMGASYNTKDLDSHIMGGRKAVMHNLTILQKQVRLFDSVNYLKSFGAGDVWVAVGWSSDVIPAAKRMSNVAVIVPKSGSSLWADLWAIPAATKFTTAEIGGRIRGPSPLIHQWIEFCLQTARGLPFLQQIIPGASPFALEQNTVKVSTQGPPNEEGRPKLDTNLVNGVPPPEILSKCEFLEPLSDKAFEDYQWLISSFQKPSHGWIRRIMHHILSAIQINKSQGN